MEFRWVALMALWTMLSGPIFGAPSDKSSHSTGQPEVTQRRSVSPEVSRSAMEREPRTNSGSVCNLP